MSHLVLAQGTADSRFERLVAQYLDEVPALSPIAATAWGDHRFDQEVDDLSVAGRDRRRGFCLRYQRELQQIDPQQLSRAHQVDYNLLAQELERELWLLDHLQEWAWNPILYTQLTGSAIYNLVARDYAPLEQRLRAVAARLEQFPRLYAQIRATLEPQRVPQIHAETAVKQNRGILSILQHQVQPHLTVLELPARQRLEQALALAAAEVEKQQTWLEQELLPRARGNPQLGRDLYDQKLALTLGTRLTRQEIRERAEFELRRVRAEMYDLARRVLPDRPAPEQPSPDVEQELIAAALEKAYADRPPRDGVVAAAYRSLELTTAFVRERDLVTIPPDPLEIIVMPEFQRGVSVAYCDAPGPLEVGQKTFYAVAPLPEDWSEEQCTSFLREYNHWSIHNLTIHEAMPGHFLQLAHANRQHHRLRALLSSGTFVEGWACYTEQMMSEEGFLDRDPLMRLITLKWYLRSITNALLDQAVHVEGIRREDALRMMTQGAFQEEREAAGKWTRAQVTSVQLSTYFVGYQEHRDLRRAVEQAWGENFSLRRYHDSVLSYGSLPVQFVRALLLDEPIRP